jgi:hypothetical protein
MRRKSIRDVSELKLKLSLCINITPWRCRKERNKNPTHSWPRHYTYVSGIFSAFLVYLPWSLGSFLKFSLILLWKIFKAQNCDSGLDTVLLYAMVWNTHGIQSDWCCSTGVQNYPNYAKDARNHDATIWRHMRTTAKLRMEKPSWTTISSTVCDSHPTYFFVVHLFIHFAVLPCTLYTFQII